METQLPSNIVLENGINELKRLMKITTQQTQDIDKLKSENYKLKLQNKELNKEKNKSYCVIL